MILFDTNVVSELMRSLPDAGVRRWADALPPASLFLSAVSQAELLYGVALLPAGRRRATLADAVATVCERTFAGRILPFDGAAAIVYAELAAARRRAGRPVFPLDAQIAAIARSRGATLATRNVTDFADCGIAVIDPWTAA